MKILLATTNQGKIDHFRHVFHTLPYTFVTLDELEEPIAPPQEREHTISDNAVLKAQYYALASGLPALADDTGLFVPDLDGWPGVLANRIGDDAQSRIDALQAAIDAAGLDTPSAYFQTALAFHDPRTDNTFIAHGTCTGTILPEPRSTGEGFGYDPIFEVADSGKTFGELSLNEKHSVSHRGKAISQMKYYLHNQFGAKQFIVPIGLIVRDGKILLNKRNDPFNEHMHGKWEFPGGGMEYGETIEDNLIREVREEAGYDVRIIAKVNHVGRFEFEKSDRNLRYQVYLLPHVCTITGGDGVVNDEEVLDTTWVTPTALRTMDGLVGENYQLIVDIIDEVESIIETHNL